MKPTIVCEDIFRLSLNVEDLLFEQMWEIPNGVTLNSYLVKGEKTALIDGVCGWDGVPEKLYDLLSQMDIELDQLDYIIINHMEPDHSGWIEDIKGLKSDLKIYCTRLAAGLLEKFFGITEGVIPIKSGDTLDLGNGKVLEFIQQPNVHWPDTMFTLERSSKTLFTCDMFGSFGICEGNDYDDEFTKEDSDYFWEEQIRYYSNVLVTFNGAVHKAIEKTIGLDVAVIAPGHGPVYRQNPKKLIENYEKIAGFVEKSPLDEVTIIWGSMYGMTEKAVNYIVDLLEEEGTKYNILQVPHVSIGSIMSKSIRAKTIIIAAPTYENNLFSPMATVLEELARKKIHNKAALYVGSYGWAGGGSKEVTSIVEGHKMKWQMAEPVTFKGAPETEDLEKLKATVLEII